MSQLPWQAEYRVSTSEARHLAGLPFGLPCNHIEFLGEGWDYLNFLADEQWVLRFPKISACDTVLVREQRICPRQYRTFNISAVLKKVFPGISPPIQPGRRT